MMSNTAGSALSRWLESSCRERWSQQRRAETRSEESSRGFNWRTCCWPSRAIDALALCATHGRVTGARAAEAEAVAGLAVLAARPRSTRGDEPRRPGSDMAVDGRETTRAGGAAAEETESHVVAWRRRAVVEEGKAEGAASSPLPLSCINDTRPPSDRPAIGRHGRSASTR